MANKKTDEPAQDEQSVSIELDGKQVAQTRAVERRLDYAPRGGRYIVNGVLVDANGQPVKDA